MKQTLPFFFILFFVFPVSLSAQSDSPAESKSWFQQDPFGYFQPQKQLLKLNLFRGIQRLNEQEFTGLLSLGYERKFGTLWSVQSELSTMYHFTRDQNITSSPSVNGIVGFSAGPRFYYEQKSRITYGRQVSNLVGNYIGINVSTRLLPMRPQWRPEEIPYYVSDNFALIPHLGWQFKVLKYGFVDARLGIKASYGDPRRTRHFFPRNADKFWQIIPISTIRAGIAF